MQDNLTLSSYASGKKRHCYVYIFVKQQQTKQKCKRGEWNEHIFMSNKIKSTVCRVEVPPIHEHERVWPVRS